jgi:hypothetical protein
VRRIATWVLAAAAGYLLLLLLGGLVAGRWVEARLQARFGAAMGAKVAVGSCDVSLLRGRIELRDVAMDRDEGGSVRVRVERIDIDTAPLGWMLIDRSARDALVEGAVIELSAAGAVALRELRAEPLRLRQLRLERVRMQIAPTALLPWLGRVDVDIVRARTRPVAMRSALGWISAIAELEARVEGPGATAEVGYRDGMLRVKSSLFGPVPFAVPFALPATDAASFADERAELRALALRLAAVLGKQGVKHWLERNLIDPLRDAAK